ncbi:nucleotidyl transferase [Azospirillum thiophilum]|uniref:Nucleotidyl transferase n=1 Tax=Azospirillum thiophilum TaxID=528244 RepID=A0AAC8W5M5_9PROT|nr:phosphocholine cytidylyltransferase family protein [Azospirillum thiophilum]ALG75541.1 nucleotidyl transferase [Azospirillum thiophilum]KJR62061.1 nucleotidyl transferase [Azospirillum thiophilum]
MKAIILAAGRGSRMKAMTEDRPKCLVEIAGRSLLDCQRAALTGAGAGPLAVVRGYRGEAFEGRGLTLFDNPRWAETNMVMSLVQAAPWLSAEPCLVSYADIFYPAETVCRLMAAEGDIVISYDPDWLALWQSRFADPLADAESFLLDATGRVVDIGRKVQSLDEIQGQYMGLLKFTPAGWAQVTGYLDGLEPAARDKLDMTGLLSRLIAAGVAIRAVPSAPGWGEVDSESDLDHYIAEVAAGRVALPV